MRIIATGIALTAALVASLARSATIEPYSCRNGLFSSEQDELRQAAVAGDKAEKLIFYQDVAGCPEGGEKCKSKAYVLPGDEMIVNKVRGDWACGWFNGKKHETVGWVDARRLQFLREDEVRDLNRWAGKWKFYSNVIEISTAENKLHVKGSADWNGGKNSAGVPVVHTGDIEGEITPQNGWARLVMDAGPYSCQANFTLLGRYLVVTDNSNCGGVNVRFDGVYTKDRQ